MNNPSESSTSADQQALLDALNAVIQPLARLAVAQGVPYAQVDELMRQAFVLQAKRAALSAAPQAAPHRLVSRISSATGINRREVGRLLDSAPRHAVQRRSPPMEAYTRWISDEHYTDGQGRAMPLARQGEAPSFESLAQAVTKDVHPRAILDELIRIGLVRWDASSDVVEVSVQRFVPGSDKTEMARYLGLNVGDHLSAAADNYLGVNPKTLEQSLFATGIPVSAVDGLVADARGEWQDLIKRWSPKLQHEIDAGEAEAAMARVRIGMFVYAEPTESGEDPS